jgi:hypothetical protein
MEYCNKWLDIVVGALSATAILLILPMATANAQSDQEQAMQVLVLLYSARDTDDKCGGLGVEERQKLDGLIELGLSESELTAEQLAFLEKGLSKDEIDCQHPGFIEMFRAVFQKTDEEPGNDPENAEGTEDALKKRLEAVTESLPKGQLAQLGGCWSADMSGWNFRLCFTRNGDGAELVLTQAKSGATCSLPAGEARSREGGAFFYAYPDSAHCSDGRKIGHVEGMCSQLGETSIHCLVSVFEHANIFFMDSKDSSDGLNGELYFTRKR